jgi:hypothetical protein
MVTLDNYKEFLPSIRESIVADDSIKQEILFQIDDFEKLLALEVCLLEIKEFFIYVNYWISIGLIKLKDIDQVNINEQKKTSFLQSTRPTYPLRNNLPQKPVIISNPDNGLQGQENITLNQLNSNNLDKLIKSDFFDEKKNPEILETHRPTYINSDFGCAKPPITDEQKKKDENLQTIRPTYINKEDEFILKELDLPKNKTYIYQEIRKLLGRPIQTEQLEKFGVNKLARKIVAQYPEGFKKTEIKAVLNIVLTYDKLINA